MRVVIGQSRASLAGADEFNSFDFTSPLDPQELKLALTDLRLGVSDADGEHAWIAVDALVGLAGPMADEQWREQLAGMAAYAASRGWVDSEGRLRAHRAGGQ
jgi:hypothetical protein